MSDTADLLPIIRGVGGDPADLPFWQGCREGLFLVHRCNLCGRSYWPASRCVDHGARNMAWVQASGRARLYTYTVLHHAFTPAMKGRTPYVVGVVKLEEGPLFHTNIVDCAWTDVAVDMDLEMTMETREDGFAQPVFRPVR